MPLAYEVLPGNTADNTTLRGFLVRIERQYGKARRMWVMDRGIPTEEVLQEMRGSDPPVYYLVGTPKGRLSRLEKELLGFHGIMGELSLSHARREVDYLARWVAAHMLKYIDQIGVDIDALQLADHNQVLDDPDLFGAESSSSE